MREQHMICVTKDTFEKVNRIQEKLNSESIGTYSKAAVVAVAIQELLKNRPDLN